MSFIHDESQNATKSELDLFIVPSTQTAIESSHFVKYKHLSSIGSSKVIEFHVPATDEYIDPNEIYLHIKCKVTKSDGTNLSNETVAQNQNTDLGRMKLSNYTLFSLFQSLEVSLGSELVTQASNTYPYRCLFESLLDSSEDAHKYYFQAAGMSDDASRAKMINGSKTIDLYGKLHGDLFKQTKLLLNQTPMTIKLTRASDTFCIQITDPAAETKAPTVAITEASLYIRRVKLFPDVDSGIAYGLERAPAKYFISRNEVRTFNIPAGQTSYSLDNIYMGQLPRRFMVAFIPNASFTGIYTSDSFDLKAHNVTSIVSFVDGKMLPNTPYTPDYDENCYAREYFALFSEYLKNRPTASIPISYEDFKNKYNFYAFNLSPDQNEGYEQGVLSLLKRGNVRVEFQLKTAPTTAQTMLVYGEFDSLIEIDKNRNVTKDY